MDLGDLKEDEHYCLMGCDAMQSGILLSMFQRNMMPLLP
jgi:hypothetical protein